MSYIMDGGEQIVYSAGNSWIVCRSKSYAGRIYYFNTLTGEAAWNLSDSEVEKAKQRTKSLAKQNKINIQECPEPEEPPMDQTNAKPSQGSQRHQFDLAEGAAESSSSRVYNKQVINNKITKQSYPFPYIVSPYNVVANPMNPMLPIAVNPTPGFNSNVWAVPPNHQLYMMGPSVPSLVNQSQPTPVNVAFEEQDSTFTVKNTSTLSGQFQNLRNAGFHSMPHRGRGRGRARQQRLNFTSNRENHKFRQHYEQYQNNFRKDIGANDLRKLLSAKKQRRASFHEYTTQEGYEAENVAANTTSYESHSDNPTAKQSDCESDGDNLQTRQSDYESDGEYLGHDRETRKDKIGTNDADSDWLEEHILVEDRKLKLDISNLKKIAKPEMDPDCWYIVADKDVLLHHLNFLNILCNSDDHCFLMVAQQVMAELHEVSRDKSSPRTARTAARARRAVSFLLQQLDAGYVVIGDGTCGENDTRCDYLLNCCSNLYEQNFHVILFSNDNEFDAYKNSTNIPIFNIKEIKQFLTKDVQECRPDRLISPPKCKTPEIQKTDRLKPPPCLTKPGSLSKRPIKITVANDLAKPTDDKTKACKITIATQFKGDVDTTEKCFETVPEEKDTTEKCFETVPEEKDTTEKCFETVPEEKDTTEKCFETVPEEKDTTEKCFETVPEEKDTTEKCFETVPEEKDTTEKCFETVLEEKDTTENCFETVPEENDNISHVNNSISSIKTTVESAVQTDFQIEAEFTPSRDNVFIFPQTSRSEVREKTPEGENEPNNDFTTPYVSKREIRLNRSHQNSVKTSTSSEDTSNNVGKKHFKWRRKRHVSSSGIDSKLSSANSSNADETSRDYLNIQKADKVSTSCEQTVPRNKFEESLSSEASSLLITRNVTNGTLIVEETSTSGIISNSESEGGNKDTNLNETRSQKSVMYEVTDQTMEECLRTMNDEWVSRFIQIMEEVLDQVLRKDEKFLNEVVYKLHGGGPWNIREAADCIKRKFNNNEDIVEAASKLTDIYIKISDPNGRITANIQPSEFMEMYSFGKHLIESMLSVLQDCEDLESAAQSLQRLLADIQNPDFDASHNEAFDTHPQDFTAKDLSSVNDDTMPSSKINETNTYTTPTTQIIRRSERVTKFNSSAVDRPKKAEEIPQSNSPGQAGLKRAEQVIQYHSPERNSLRGSGEVTLTSPGQGSHKNAELVRLSNSPGQGSLRKAKEDVQSQSPVRSSLPHSGKVTQSNSPGLCSPKRPEEVTKFQSPGRRSLRTSHSPRQGSFRSADVIQSSSPEKGDLRRNEEFTQSISPGQSGQRISDQVLQSISPVQGSLRITEDDIQSHSPGKSGLRKSGEVIQSHSPGQGSLRRDEEIIQSKSPSKGTPYRLRSRNKSCPQNDAVDSGNKKIDNIKLIRNVGVKHNFLTSLNLVQKVGEDGSQPIETDSPPKPGTKEPVAGAVDTSSQDLMRSIFNRNLDENSQVQSCTESKTETKVIRNFTICPEFEKKLVKPVEREPLDMDQLDYSDIYNDDDNFMNEDYYSLEDYFDDNGVQDKNATDENNLVNTRDVSEEEMPVIRKDPNAYIRVDDKFICDSPLNMNNTLNTIFDTMINRVKEQLLNVQTFCKETREVLSASQKHSMEIKYEMNENAERAQILLTNMIKSLNSIFCRETYEPEKNIQTLLKGHGIHDFDLNDSQLKVYRDMIGQCLEQAQILQESFAFIVTAIKKKPIE